MTTKEKCLRCELSLLCVTLGSLKKTKKYAMDAYYYENVECSYSEARHYIISQMLCEPFEAGIPVDL